MSGCRRVRYPLTADAPSLPHDVRSLYPERFRVRGAPRKSLGICRRVTNKGKSGFVKASYKIKAKDLRPPGIPVEVWRGALLEKGKSLAEGRPLSGSQSLSQAL